MLLGLKDIFIHDIAKAVLSISLHQWYPSDIRHKSMHIPELVKMWPYVPFNTYLSLKNPKGTTFSEVGADDSEHTAETKRKEILNINQMY